MTMSALFRRFLPLAAGLVLATLPAFPSPQAGPEAVKESARKIPVAFEGDVVVVGGGVGAVAAAEAAAKAGAKVFLVSPRTYLGEDVAGTLRVWTRPDQELTTDLARKLFGADGRATGGGPAAPAAGTGLPLKYETDRPSGPQHKDTRPPSALTDGRWQSPVDQSVQYDGPVTVTADLGESRDVGTACLMAFHAKDFLVESVSISTSLDRKDWKDVAVVRNSAEKGAESTPAVPLGAAVNAKVRYVRFQVKPAGNSPRILLGEVIVSAPAGAAAAPPRKEDATALVLVRPLHVKRTLDETLIAAGVQYLHGCTAVDVLRDAYDKPSGIVMANRAGRQAVIARVVIDATDRAWVARMAGAKEKPFPAGPQTFKRVVVGGELRTGEGVAGRTLPETFGGRPVHEYTLRIPMRDGGFAAWAEAEQKARDLTYHKDQAAAADFLFQVPPDPIAGAKSGEGEWPGAAKLELDAFRPAGIERLYVLGGAADLPRPQAEKLLEPPAIIELGARLGAAAAKEAKSVPDLRGLKLAGRPAPGGAGDARELLEGVRPHAPVNATVDQPARALPVLGSYDVVVVGGGTSGAPAGIAAARQGAKTLLIEVQCGLGGVGTLGMIASYYWGNKVGFTQEVQGGLKSWNIEHKGEWWRSEFRKAGGELWYAASGCGAYVEGDRVRGVVVATPEGRGVVLAKAVIDGTGNADVAAAAGAATVTTGADDVALQGTGLPPRDLGKNYTNTDYTLVDDTDLVDLWRLFVAGRQIAKNAFDQGPLIDSRERRRIVGDFTITILDEVLDRTHPDTVLQAYSNFDTHGYTVEPYFTLHFPHKKGIATNVPYRAMLPKGIEGLLVVGLGMSVHRDALPVVRMQPDLQNGGYAAGAAAAMAAKAGSALRAIDLKALQRHLVEIGNLKESVLTDKDNFPLPASRVEAAVKNPSDPYIDTAVILAHPKEALPHVKQAFAQAKDGKEKLHQAQVLSVLGDASGLDTLIAAIKDEPGFDKGWRYVGMGQFGASMSPLDCLFYAVGRLGDRKATPALVEKAKLLKPETEFSHFRALAWALDRIADPAAAAPLAEALSQPGVRGMAVTFIEKEIEISKRMHWTSTEPRANALRELFLARALYRCGDRDGLGKKVLEEYTRDLQGHFARHARAVLQAK
jgi:flavin-dependent dehydrogenase